MTDAALRSPAVTTQWRVTVALAGRALRITLRRVQFLLPSFVLPLLLLVVIASGTSAAQELPGFPVQSSYVGFVVSGTIIQGALLVGLMAGIAVADEIEGGFFDRLLSAPINRASIVAGRVLGTMGIGVFQAVLFLLVALVFGADFTGGLPGALAVVALAALSAGAAAALGASIALKTGSLSLLQNLFPIVFVLLFTAPAFLPHDYLNPTLQAISDYNPLTYVVEGMRGALFDSPGLGSVPLGFLSAAVLLAAMFALAVWAMRSRVRT